MSITRRDLLKAGTAVAVAAAAADRLAWANAWAADQPFAPEKGAKLRFLRWSKFLDSEDRATTANIQAFSRATGVDVKVESEFIDNIQTKVAVAANVGGGPDIVWGVHTTPHLFPDKLLDVTDVADYVGKKYGGWYSIIEKYGKNGDRWIAIPSTLLGTLPNYRISWVGEAGFDSFPTDIDGFLKLCRNLQKAGHPAGFAFSKAPSDANPWCHWLLWSHGGKVVDEENKVTINSKETIAALKYAKAVYETMIPGTMSWNDVSNNQAFLGGHIALTNNSPTIYGKAVAENLPIAADIGHAFWPIGPVGKPTEMHIVNPLMGLGYTKYPQAVKAFLAFMMERAQYEALIANSQGYVTQVLRAYENNVVWERDPKIRVFKDVGTRALPVSHAGTLGYASASVLSDFVVVDMFADVATGALSPEESAQKAERRAKRYYS